MSHKPFKLIVVGTSQGGFEALKAILTPLPVDFPLPILVVRHQPADSDDCIIKALRRASQLKVKFAEKGDLLQPGTVYIAPPDRHLMVEKKGCLNLSTEKKVNFSRPSIEPLFKSAAQAHGSSLLVVVLTGANADGAEALRAIKAYGGTVLVQDSASAEADTMPKAALAAVEADYVIWLDQIGPFLWQLSREG